MTELFVDWLGGGAGDSPTMEYGRAGGRAVERNLLRYVFLDERAPRFIVDWGERARRLVAEYRADTAGWRDDPVRKAFVHELCTASVGFEAAWRSQQVLSREGGLRAFQHPKHGNCTYEQYTPRMRRGWLAGIDPSSLMVQQARARLQPFAPTLRVDVREGTDGDLDWPEACFTQVAALHSFQFWRDADATLTRIRALLVPGGRLLLVLRSHAQRLANVGSSAVLVARRSPSE